MAAGSKKAVRSALSRTTKNPAGKVAARKSSAKSAVRSSAKKSLDRASTKKTAGTTKKSASTKKSARGAGDDLWPRDRNVLFRPDRLKYVRKEEAHLGCPFCNAANSAISFESLLVYKTKYSMIVLNKFPYNPGHVLVIPTRHCGDFLDLSNEEYTDLHETLRLAFDSLRKAFRPGGVNIGLNNGPVAGAGIPDHLHYHLVPRWSGDLNFFPLIADTKVVPTSLEETFNRMVEVLG